VYSRSRCNKFIEKANKPLIVMLITKTAPVSAMASVGVDEIKMARGNMQASAVSEVMIVPLKPNRKPAQTIGTR
jgi:hypothetical protein